MNFTVIYASILHYINMVIFAQRYLEPDETKSRYTYVTERTIPHNREPSPGLNLLEHLEYQPFGDFQYKDQDPAGPPPLSGIARIIRQNFPQFAPALSEYCRPTSSPDSAFSDFNKPQSPIPALDSTVTEIVLELLDHFFDMQPYNTIHWADTRFADLPLSTAADYYHRTSTFRTAHAATSHPIWSAGPTKKSWYINVHLEKDRTVAHNFKTFRYPFNPNTSKFDKQSGIQSFYFSHPTMIHTRSHLSKRTGPFKVRPVYNVPMLYLRMETMLFYPILCHLLKGTSCMLYGYETIRGGLHRINQIAYSFNSYLMFDWSSFDQTVPFPVIAIFFLQFIPKYILVNTFYADISNYPYSKNFDSFFHRAQALQQKGLFQDIPTDELAYLLFAQQIYNLLISLWTWYQNMVLLNGDGFAYLRSCAGILSGFLLTQFLDSFCNLFVMIYSMLNFGFTPDEIKQMRFFILGDDNVIFTLESLNRMLSFFLWIPDYAEKTFHMKISIKKSLITSIRSKIEVLSYRSAEGLPRRDVMKLVGQFAYPERHTDEFINIHRCIGFAYANCAQDLAFHELCRQCFLYYRTKAIQLRIDNPVRYEKHTRSIIRNIYVQMLATKSTIHTKSILKNEALPGPIQALLSLDAPIPNLEHFPSFTEVQTYVSRWHGPLSTDTKWNRKYFLNPPTRTKSTKNVTLFDVLQKYPHQFESNTFLSHPLMHSESTIRPKDEPL
nr:RNA-dependent RNA polymerase [Terfezia claveryi partitivirus 1]